MVMSNDCGTSLFQRATRQDDRGATPFHAGAKGATIEESSY